MTWDFDKCVSVLTEETVLLQKISMVHNSVHNAVMNREWTDFEWKIAEITQLGEEFTLLENERISIFTGLREKYNINMIPDSENSFYAMAARLPENQCRILSGLYRELRMETLKLRARNETFTNYLNEVKTVTAAWLEAIFPVQGGKLYTQKGRQAAAEMHSIVLNHRI